MHQNHLGSFFKMQLSEACLEGHPEFFPQKATQVVTNAQLKLRGAETGLGGQISSTLVN